MRLVITLVLELICKETSWLCFECRIDQSRILCSGSRTMCNGIDNSGFRAMLHFGWCCLCRHDYVVATSWATVDTVCDIYPAKLQRTFSGKILRQLSREAKIILKISPQTASHRLYLLPKSAHPSENVGRCIPGRTLSTVAPKLSSTCTFSIATSSGMMMQHL